MNATKAFPVDHPVLLFDGTCVLCNTFFQWVIRKDKNQLFRFATLQSDFAKDALLNSKIKAGIDTVILFDQGRYYTYSTAALKTMILIGGFGKVLGILGMAFPKVLRDWIYRIIARYRYKWFGQKECMVPGKALKGRFY